jgi:hypothetical protein
LVLCAGAGFSSSAAAQTPKPPPVVINEEDLQRVAPAPCQAFPWLAPVGPKPDVKTAKTDSAGLPDMTGDILIRATGHFSREVPKDGQYAGMEVLTLSKDVEIEQLEPKSVLRGQTIKVIRGRRKETIGQESRVLDVEILEAQGGVEVVMPERKGRGDSLRYEVYFRPAGEEARGPGRVVKNEYVLLGDAEKGRKATLWQGEDVIQAMEFRTDGIQESFRVRGLPVAELKAPGDAGGARPKPAGAGAGSPLGSLPGLGLAGGGKIRLQADGEIFYEGPGGRVHITRKVVIQQDAADGTAAMIMTADEAWLSFLPPQPGGTEERTGVFSGSVKALECSGGLEIKTPAQTVLCDRGVLDLQRKTFLMQMTDAKDSVRVYMRESTEGGKVLVVPHFLKVAIESGEMEAGGPRHIESYTGQPPSNRTGRK